MIRVLAPSDYPGMTKTVRSNARAEDRARWVAQLAGSAEIQQRSTRTDDWLTITRFEKSGTRVLRRPGGER